MSIQAVSWVLDDEDIPARPKLVLLAIANHANHTDGYCWLKAETIAKEGACNPRSVFRFVGDLIRNGYIRKAPRRGGDGKQRANDYWILLDRPATKWISTVRHDSEQEETEDSPSDEAAEEPPVDAAPYDTLAYGTEEPPTVDKHVESCGPYDSRVSHKDSAEPSKTKPKTEIPNDRTPRGYQRPPPAPPDPIGSTTLHGNGDMIFVYAGTPGYEAWATLKARQLRLPKWHMTTTKIVDGKNRSGWYFQSVFPPNEGSLGVGTSLATEEELQEFGRTG